MTDSEQKWIKSMEWCSKHWGCHQFPERSFFYKGYQLPVCARCTGIIVGYIVSIIYALLFNIIPLMVCILMIIPMAIDGTIQLLTRYKSNNIKRFVTGTIAGFAFIQLAKSLIFIILRMIL